MTSSLIAARVVIFTLNTVSGGWREQVFTFDTFNHEQDIREQIHEQVLERDIDPGIYVATVSVIGGHDKPKLYMYTFEVYEEPQLVGGCPCGLTDGVGAVLYALGIEMVRGCRPFNECADDEPCVACAS